MRSTKDTSLSCTVCKDWDLREQELNKMGSVGAAEIDGRPNDT